MTKELDLSISPDFIDDYEHHKKLAAGKLKINPLEISSIRVIKKSIDARRKIPVFKLKTIVYINELPGEISAAINFTPVSDGKKVIIVGSGPAGLFAALGLIELGVKPIIFERGKDVQSRRRDLKSIQLEGIVDPDSNYCFGEGGAGTYSDGKLYTRSIKRGNISRILQLFIQHGASNDIKIDSHPHIGSNKLPQIVKSFRDTISKNNGEFYFNSKVTGLLISKNKIRGVIVNNEKEFVADAVILATGHSAREIYYLLKNNAMRIEAKPFAMGVRVEHPQQIIDKIQYHSNQRHPNLPASNYNLSCQVDGRGVYSFCMCPGGIIIPSSTEPGELVLNGMSVSRRDSPYANSGIVVSIDEKDWIDFNDHGSLAGMMFQKQLEQIAFRAGGGDLKAPAQRITDFVKNKVSSTLPKTSYIPGIVSAPLHEILPLTITSRIKKSLRLFDKKMHGYFTNEAQILAAETRTSSPVKIPRNTETLMHIDVKGLFPAGEGAGYAGGIVSAAIDGQRCAEAVVKFVNKN